ncbi:MAG: hypothetical protein MJ185_08765 [Treponema sp.]|nr:hypothetical protein [Treponema sp.]
MVVGAVLSYKNSFFSFKDKKILIRLKTPVFQLIVQERGFTCTSKKIEFYLNQDLSDMEVKIMGKSIKTNQLKVDFVNLSSSLWISAQRDIGDIQEKLRGFAEASKGKMIFVQDFDDLAKVFTVIERYGEIETNKNKTIIKEYCEKNIELINNQIRLLTGDKNLYMDLMKTL